MRRVVIGVLVSLALLCAGLVATAAPAAAEGGCASATCAGGTPSGYTVTAVVHFSGDAAPGGGGSVSMAVPATCWWSPENQVGVDPPLDYSDPSTWLGWYDNAFRYSSGTFSFARVYLGDRSMWEAAVQRAQAGDSIGLYAAHCRPDAGECAQIEYVGGSTMAAPGITDCGLAAVYRFFPDGNPPAPQVDPEDLARLARDRMVIPDPVVDRNPKVGALGQATLVGLPTWFWVTNPASVGGDSGTRTIRAEVGAVWAEVVARTGGLTITSPAGGASCPPLVAHTPYTPGAADSSGCTVDFQRASVGYPGGYPVDASTAWTATWTGSGGTGGDLEGLARNAQVAVPVAESQALVNGS